MSKYGELFQAGLEGRRLDDVQVIDMHGHYGACFQFNVPHYGIEDILSEMDCIGIDKLILSGFPALVRHPREGHEETLQVCKAHPDRIFMHYVVNPHYASEQDELFAPYSDESQVKGFKIHCEIHGHPIDGPGYEWAWRMSAEMQRPVLTHIGVSDIPNVPKVAQAHPEAIIIIAHHFGPENLDKALPLVKDIPNIVVDTPVSLLPLGTVERLVAEFGVHRVLFGTDMPYLNAGGQVGKVLLAKLSDTEKRSILAENAKRLFDFE